ncbi:MAG: lamin tail domain-containing protein, partial [Planctomycetota bacterium]
MKTSFLSLVLVALWAVCAGAGDYLPGDIDEDRDIDFADLRLLAQRWLDPNCLMPGCEANLDGLGGVNNVDFALLTRHWGGTVVITEFMASNHSRPPLEAGEVLDEDEESSDWIELFNPTDKAVDLGGWYLTDDGDEDPNFTKWRFPAGVVLKSGEFLLVFASLKNRAVAGAELHTNFKLSDDEGKDLLLVRPDGVTVADKYSPYPKQLSDISYGIAQHAQKLVPERTSVLYHVPDSDDAGAHWIAIDFDDSQWEAGRTALGFSSQPGVAARDIGGAAPAGSYSAAGEAYTLSGSGADIWGNSDSFYFVYLPLAGDGEISARVASMTDTHDWAKCGVMIRETLDPGSKNAFCYMASQHGKSIQSRIQTNSGSSHSNTEGYSVPYWVRLVRTGDTFSYYHSDDGIDWVLQSESGSMSNPATIPMNQNVYMGLAMSSHVNGQLCTALFDNVTFGNEVTSDLAQAMLGNNCSLWARIRFDLDEDEPEMFDNLMLRMKYEDGFAAYLNGERVASGNAPDSLQWNSAALMNRPGESSSVFESIDLDDYRYLLRSGTNVLAVHALNDQEDDEDFLILPELSAASDLGVPQYFTTPSPLAHNSSGSVALVGEVWFSHKRGFYDAPFDLILSTESSGAEILYTLDGSEPTMTHGDIYESTQPLRIDGTSTIRAAAFEPGYLTPKVETHTFVFPADVPSQSTMSTVITGDPTWGPQIRGALLDVPTISLVTPHSISEAEKETSVEMIFPDGKQGFQVDAGVEHFGGHSLNYPKNNMRISFKSIYGPTRLKFDFFEEVPFGAGTTDEFDQFLLRTGSHDTMFWTQPGTGARGTYMRNRWIMDRQLESGQPAPRGRFVHVYINGVYWGLHHLMERPNAPFMASYFGGDKTEYDSVKGDWGTLKAIAGDLNAWRAMEGSTGD